MRLVLSTLFEAAVAVIFVTCIGVVLVAVSSLAEASVHPLQEVVEDHSAPSICHTIVINGDYATVPLSCHTLRTALGGVDSEVGVIAPPTTEQSEAVLNKTAAVAGIGLLLYILVFAL